MCSIGGFPLKPDCITPLDVYPYSSLGMDSVNVNKLVRSLLSGFPNEVDFAFNILSVLSFESREIISLNKLSHLLAVLLAHVAVFSKGGCGFSIG